MKRIDLFEPAGGLVPTGRRLVHQPPLHDQPEVVHCSLAKNLSQAKVDLPSTVDLELRLASHRTGVSICAECP